jgi:hypothetical protein
MLLPMPPPCLGKLHAKTYEFFEQKLCDVQKSRVLENSTWLKKINQTKTGAATK